jgi:putative endonuclease
MARRLRTPGAEVDLLLAEGDTLVACEVKTARRRGRFRPGDRLRWRALRRQARAARALAREAGLPRSRVDLVEVLLPPGGSPQVRWTRAAGPPRGRRGGSRGPESGFIDAGRSSSSFLRR